MRATALLAIGLAAASTASKRARDNGNDALVPAKRAAINPDGEELAAVDDTAMDVVEYSDPAPQAPPASALPPKAPARQQNLFIGCYSGYENPFGFTSGAPVDYRYSGCRF